MIRGTTPTHVFTFQEDFDASSFSKIQLTYCQGSSIVLVKNKEDMVVDSQSVSVTLSESETLKFLQDVVVDIQIKVLTDDGHVMASQVFKIPALRVLNDTKLGD